MRYTVCGLETVSITGTVTIKKEYELGSSVTGTNTTWYIYSEEFESYMVSSDSECPLYLIDVIQNPVYTAGAVTSFDIALRPEVIMESWGTNSNFNLRIETTDPFYYETYYFRASTQSTNDTFANNAFLEF